MMRLGSAFAVLMLMSALGGVAQAQTLEEEQAAMEAGEDGAADDGAADDGTGDEAGDAADPAVEGSSEGEDLGAPAEEDPIVDDETPGRLDDEQAEMADEDERETFDEGTSPVELEDVDYFFLGAFGRGVIIPGFIQGLFVDGGIDGFNPGVGLSFNWRRNNFNVIANVWWNNADADGFFRASGDPRTDTEFIDVNLGVIFINAEFLWSFPIVDWFAVELGFDLGFGFIYGDIVRTEAYESSSGAGDFQACDGPGSPPVGGYCEPAVPPSQPCYDANGGHYNCSEPNWFTEGGDTPFIFPWVALPHIALRFKPIRQVQIRVDGGYGLYSFFFGGSLSYGF